MKREELRVGNYVYHNHPIGARLEGVIENGVDIDLYKDFEPIPLTEEWLLEFGFRIGKSEEYYELEFFEMFGYDNGDWSFRYLNNLIKLNLKYVHQLQNLYFALTGEELIAIE